MKANKLVFDHVVDISPRTGMIKLNKKRMILTSTEAFGNLRKDLITILGTERTKSILMRFGWSSGYNAAKAVKNEFPWRSNEELILAGPALHTLVGPVMVETDEIQLDGETLYMRGSWFYSYEYEEHVKHLDFSKEGTCWTLIGYVKGYLAGVYGKDVVVYEETCRGKRDHVCTFVACTLNICPPEYLNQFKNFEQECLVSEFDEMYKRLEETQLTMQRANQLIQKMTNSLLKDESLQQLLHYISNEIGHSVLVERSNVRKSFGCSYEDEEHEQIYARYTNGEGLAVGSFVEVFPIKSDKVYYGKVIVVGDGQLDENERILVEQSIPSFLWYFNMRYKTAEKLWQKKVELFSEQPATLNPDTSFLNVIATQKNRAFVVKSDIDELYTLYLFLEKFVDDLFISGEYIVALMDDEQEDMKLKVDYIVQQMLELFPNNKVYIGVGRQTTSIQELIASYGEAVKLCNFLVHCSQKTQQAVYYEELKHVLLFLKTADPAQLANYYRQILGKLIDYEIKNDAQLLITLQKFFDCNGNINQTAKQLNLSIPGLRYRLEKIESLIDADLKSGEGRFQCQLALQFYYAVQTISS